MEGREWRDLYQQATAYDRRAGVACKGNEDWERMDARRYGTEVQKAIVGVDGVVLSKVTELELELELEL